MASVNSHLNSGQSFRIQERMQVSHGSLFPFLYEEPGDKQRRGKHLTHRPNFTLFRFVQKEPRITFLGRDFPGTGPCSIMTELIEPRTLKGFRDYLPALMIPRERLLEQARRVYRPTALRPSTRRPWNTPKSCSARAARNRTSSSIASRTTATATWPCAST